MALSVSFFLVYSRAKITRDRLQDHPTSIRAQIRYTRSHLNWSTARRLGHTIERIQITLPLQAQPRYWKDGRVRHNHPNAVHINTTLDEISARAVSLHAQYVAAGAFPPENDIIAAILGAQEATSGNPTTLLDYYRLYVAYLVDRKVGRTTTTRHRYIIQILTQFQTAAQYPLNFETLNKTFAARFTAWARTHLPQRRAAQDIQNTVQRYLKDLRNFLSHAHTEGWTHATTWRQIRPKPPKPNFPITVTQAEIDRIASLTPDDLGRRYRHSNENVLLTRDWFLLGTQTALRWSDWQKRNFQFIHHAPNQVDLQFHQKKTGDPLAVPLSPLALTILRRHNFQMPATFSPAITLTHLRHIAAAAGIGKHITTHTARRTFCTLQEAAGVPRAVIMRITGHQTEKDYLRYTGITYRVNADLLRRANPAMFTNTAS